MPTFRMLCYFEVVIANPSIVVMVMLFVIYNFSQFHQGQIHRESYGSMDTNNKKQSNRKQNKPPMEQRVYFNLYHT